MYTKNYFCNKPISWNDSAMPEKFITIFDNLLDTSKKQNLCSLDASQHKHKFPPCRP